MHHYWPAVLHDAPGGALAQRPKLSNPEQFPAGPLREYMQWLHQLWLQAAEPSSHELAERLGCSHTTVARLFKGLPPKKRRAYDLLVHLYEHPRGRKVQRSEGELDAFCQRIDDMLKYVEEAAKAAEPEGRAKGVAPYTVIARTPLAREDAEQAHDEAKAAQQPAEGHGPRGAYAGPEPSLSQSRKLLEPGGDVPGDELFRVSSQGFLHVIGSDRNSRYRQDELRTPESARTVLERMASPVLHDDRWESRVFFDTQEDTAAAIRSANVQPAGAILAIFEGFHRAYIGGPGICLARRTSPNPMYVRHQHFTLFDLIPMYEKAVVLLAGNVYADEWDDDGLIGVTLRGPVSMPQSEAVIAEVFPPEGLSGVLEILADRLASVGDDPPVSFIVEQLNHMPWVKKCVVVGPPELEELSCG
ncbi:hypothetical protein AB0948_25240 [Streptomyces koyangensis]|uniref:hypothetical protein n=1 Tax=Streptomyces koyangensis TaxID=188770 RepID=UPI003455FC1F